MIDANGIETRLLYHVVFVVGAKFGDLTIERLDYVRSHVDLDQIRQAAVNWLNAQYKPVPPYTIRDLVLIQTPVALSLQYYKDGKPYEPPVDAPG